MTVQDARRMFKLTDKQVEDMGQVVDLTSTVVYREFEYTIITYCLMKTRDGVWCRGTTFKSMHDTHCKATSRTKAMFRAFAAAVRQNTNDPLCSVYPAVLSEFELRLTEHR